MGSVSGPFKTFMDASSRVWLEQKWKDKLAAGFTISGSFSGVMAQAGQVAPDVEPNAADRKTAERIGQRVAAAARWARVS